MNINQGKCDISLSPPVPSEINHFAITSYDIDSEVALGKILVQVHHINIEWTVPIDPVTTVANLGYQIWIGIDNTTHNSDNEYNLDNITSLNEVSLIVMVDHSKVY